MAAADKGQGQGQAARWCHPPPPPAAHNNTALQTLSPYLSLCAHSCCTPVQVGCHLAMGMAEQASEQQSSALLSKSLALLTLCGHLAASSTTASGTTTAGRSGEQLPLQPQLQQQPQQVEILDPPGDLLASLAPAVGMLCANAALSTSPPHRRAAQDALNGLMRGLPPQLRLGCMRALLQTLQPEAAALLLQLLRREVAVAWPASPSEGGATGAGVGGSGGVACVAR